MTDIQVSPSSPPQGTQVEQRPFTREGRNEDTAWGGAQPSGHEVSEVPVGHSGHEADRLEAVFLQEVLLEVVLQEVARPHFSRPADSILVRHHQPT